jgi:undecaprenyl-diphosphatase
MTTFQAVMYAISHAISNFFPIGTHAQHALTSYLLEWDPPSTELLGALNLGSCLSLLLYFRHDWASLISCLLQILIYRKRPMTLDERLPLFMGVTLIPMALSWTYLQTPLVVWINQTPLSLAIVFAALGLPIAYADYFGRRIKGMYDWNSRHALILGLGASALLVCGLDPFSSLLTVALLLNYQREPASKYAYFCFAPWLVAQTFIQFKEISFHHPMPHPHLSWLSWWVALAVSTCTSLLIIGAYLRHIQNRNLWQYLCYRWILALSVLIFFWLHR